MTRPVTPITTERGDAEGFVPDPHRTALLDFLDGLAENAAPDQRKGLNPILIGQAAEIYARDLRDSWARPTLDLSSLTHGSDDEARDLAASERISAAQAVYDEAMSDYDPTDPDHEVHAFDAMKAAIAKADAMRPPASVTGTEGEKPDAERDDLTSAIATAVMGLPFSNIITQGGDLRLNPEDVEEVLTDRYGDVQKAVAAVLAKRSHPGEADRVGLGELAARFEAKRIEAAGFAQEQADNSSGPVGRIEQEYRTLARTWAEAKDMALAAHEDALIARSWGRLSAALGTGEGSGGARTITLPTMKADQIAYLRDLQASLQAEAQYDAETLIGPAGPAAGFDGYGSRARPFAPCDGSGEAGETEGLDPKGDSAVTEGQAPLPLPHPQAPNTLSEVEEATELLDWLTVLKVREIVREAMARLWDEEGAAHSAGRIRAGKWDDIDPVRSALQGGMAVARSICAALRASQEQDGEVRDA